MKTQRGLTLIELMIALTIGLVMTLGIASVYLSMKQTSTFTQRMSEVENSQRIAMTFLNTSIKGAGFYSDPVANNAATLFPAVAGMFIAGQTITGTGTGTGTGAAADTIAVRFQANGVSAIQGCSAQLNANDVYSDVFSVAGGYLTCVETDITTGAAATTINLVGGLTGMNVLYGVDSAGGGSVTEYLTGAAVTTNTLWGSVKTVTTPLLFANPLAGQPGQPATVSLSQTITYMVGR